MQLFRRAGTVLFLGSFWGACSAPARHPGGVEDCPKAKVQISPAQPRLVVWLTIDQFRGDYFERYSKHFSNNGFARLFEGGLWYRNAHFSHAITETAPGHATLFTGAEPRRHGIVGNSWLEPSGREVASVSDEDFPLLGPGVDASLDDLAKKHEGRSPRRLRLPTIADSLTHSTDGQALVFSLSAKDRGAILPGGRAGTAFWLGKKGFVTSQFYMESSPTWLDEHHRSHPPASYLDKGWPLLLPEAAYENGPTSATHTSPGGGGFPHQFAPTDRGTGTLKNTPFGDLAVLDLAKTVLAQAPLGRDESCDLLALSLSSTDYIGHAFGPESREMEDHLVRLDRALADFFSYLDQRVDAGRVLLVLSADHGGCESAGHLARLDLATGRVTELDVRAVAEQALVEAYGNSDYLLGVSSPYVYLRQDVQKDEDSSREVAQVVASALAESPLLYGAYVLPLQEVQPDDRLLSQVGASFFPGRSGQIYVVPDPLVHFVQEPELVATHGSPWEYDTHVPIVLAGAGIQPEVRNERVDVRSLAPTVAFLMGALPPAGANEPLLPAADRLLPRR